MDIVSEYSIKADKTEYCVCRFGIETNDVPTTLRDLSRLLLQAGLPIFQLTDKHKQSHLLESPEVAARVVDKNAMWASQVLKGGEIALGVSHYEAGPQESERLIIEISLLCGAFVSWRQKIDQMMMALGKWPSVLEIKLTRSGDRGCPFDMVQRALKLHHNSLALAQMVTQDFIDSQGGTARWIAHGFTFDPVDPQRHIMRHSAADLDDRNEFVFTFTRNLADVVAPVPTTAWSDEEVLYLDDFALKEIHALPYLDAYERTLGRVRTTRFHYGGGAKMNGRLFEYHRLDRDLIDPRTVPMDSFKKILAIYRSSLRMAVKAGTFSYTAKGQRLGAYKLVSDHLWYMEIFLLQEGNQDARRFCRSGVYLGYLRPSTKRKKPLPVDKDGHVTTRSFTWDATLGVSGSATPNQHGVAQTWDPSASELVFDHTDDQCIRDSFDTLVRVWLENFARASRQISVP